MTRPAQAASLLGGAVWALHGLLLAGRPTGCVAEACLLPGASSRPSEDLAPVFLAATLLLAVAATGLGRDAPRSRRSVAHVGAVLLWVGVALLALGLVVNGVVDGDSPLWWLHDTDSLGRLFPVAGSLLVGIALLGRGSLRTLAGAALAVAALVALPFNAQDGRVLLNVPLGVAWAAAGPLCMLQERSTRARAAQ